LENCIRYVQATTPSLCEYLSSCVETNETAQTLPPGVSHLCNFEPGSDPRPRLRQLLVSLLNAYHKLLSDVLEPVPSGYHRPPLPPPANGGGLSGDQIQGNGDTEWPPPLNWEATILWIRTLVLNLGWLINEFRPIQAKMALESMMQRQIDIRREETKIIHGLVSLIFLRQSFSSIGVPFLQKMRRIRKNSSGFTSEDFCSPSGMHTSSFQHFPVG